ncbi:MAG: hypothetical protein ABIN01_03770, partial [Ferruginibacter sp.]
MFTGIIEEKGIIIDIISTGTNKTFWIESVISGEDEDSRGTIRRYVVLFMPATVALLGLAVGLFRRAGEGAPKKKLAPQ